MDAATFFEEREESAKEELKRADHLIHVSLKYTRTCAVMSNALKRLISSLEMSIEEYLLFLKEKRKIPSIPMTLKEKVDLAKQKLPTSNHVYLKLYNKLTKIDKTSYCSISEYRKHLTMKLMDRAGTEIKVPDLENYLSQVKEFNKIISEICHSK
jgi:hypothetical protein